jgi:hypothetical protein
MRNRNRKGHSLEAKKKAGGWVEAQGGLEIVSLFFFSFLWLLVVKKLHWYAVKMKQAFEWYGLAMISHTYISTQFPSHRHHFKTRNVPLSSLCGLPPSSTEGSASWRLYHMR